MNNANNLVAYCGLYCPKCYKNTIAEAAESLRTELENAKAKGAGFLENISEIEENLNSLIKLRCSKFCREGGGKSSCKIKICCNNKNIEGCWKCEDFETCPNLKEQFIGNIREIKKLGIDAFIQSNAK